MRWLKEDEIKFFEERPYGIKSSGFFRRCWQEEPDIYLNRLRAIGFKDKENVLDAGCGIGQWTTCLAQLNKKVTAIDIDKDNLSLSKEIQDKLGVENVIFVVENVSKMSFKDSSFDGIFCYSVIYLTDYLKTLKEFYRVLKKDGTCYIKTNDLGRYLYMLLEQPNKSAEYDPRQEAIATLQNSLEYFANGKFSPGKQLVMPADIVIRKMQEIGFNVLQSGPDGSINLAGGKTKTFYPANYYGINGVYEILATK